MKKSLKDQKKLNKIEMLKKGFEVPNQKKKKKKKKKKSVVSTESFNEIV
jgi:hypothetical protein